MGAQHPGRPELAGEHPLTDVGQLVLFGVFLATWVTDSFLWRRTVLPAVPLPIRLALGLAVLALSALLAWRAHQPLFHGSPRLITDGPFQRVRHPLYLASWLFSAGLVIVTFSLASAAVSALILLFYYLVAKYEERLLVEKFGPSYRAYQARVPMLFPLRLRRTRG